MSDPTDQDLVAAANRGDASAMETLYYRYRDWVYALARRFCGNADDALDVLQEVFAYLFAKFPGFELRSQLKTFLYPAVKNISLNRARAQRRIVPLSDARAEGLTNSRSTPAAQRAGILQWLDALPENERELVLLRYHDAMSLREIAGCLTMPLGTVKSTLHRALCRLREAHRP